MLRNNRKGGWLCYFANRGLEDIEMATASNSRVLRIISLLIAVCCVSFALY